jgi:integrase
MAIRTYITPEEISLMIKATTNLRDRTILTLLADTGCRVSELLSISSNDFDADRKIIIIPHLKRGVKKHCPKCDRTAGRNTKFCANCGTDLSQVTPTGIEERTRMVSVGEESCSLLKEFLSAANIGVDEAIFPITRQMIYKVVRDAALAAGLSGRVFLNPETGKHHYVHPHDFRSALAVSWLEVAGGDANKQKALQSHLGHKSFDTTMRYNKLTPKAISDIGDEVRKRRFG